MSDEASPAENPDTGSNGAAIGEADVPSLPRGVRLREDKVRGATVLLGPERTIGIDPVAAAILHATDGERTVGQIVDHLAAAYNAPRDTILSDVTDFLRQMHERRLIEVRS